MRVPGVLFKHGVSLTFMTFQIRREKDYSKFAYEKLYQEWRGAGT